MEHYLSQDLTRWLPYVNIRDMKSATKEGNMKASDHTITILANLNSGDMIVRATFGSAPRRMTRCEMEGHRACGVTIINKRRG